MPQLDISTFSSQIFWFLISFFLLFSVVHFIFLPVLCGLIYTRNEKMLSSFRNSLFLLKFIEDQINKYNIAVYGLKREMQEIINDTYTQVDEIKAHAKNVLAMEKKRVDKLVEIGITKFKYEHMDELKQMSISIALIYYTKLANSEIDEGFVANLISKEF